MFLKFFTAQYQIRRLHPKNRDGGDAVNQATPVHLNLTMKPIAIKELSRPALSALESILGLCLAPARLAGVHGRGPRGKHHHTILTKPDRSCFVVSGA